VKKAVITVRVLKLGENNYQFSIPSSTGFASPIAAWFIENLTVEVKVVTDESNDYRSATAYESVGTSVRSARTLNKLLKNVYLQIQNTQKPPH
jgi:membrane-anchored protein YejM (alkaline phosphatase superfamily)